MIVVSIDDIWNIRLWAAVAEYASARGVRTCFAPQIRDLCSSEWKLRLSDCTIMRDLAADGHEICSHSYSHLWSLESLPDEDLKFELEGSKAALEECLSRKVYTIVYPHGFYGPRTIEAAVNCGYEAGRTVRADLPGKLSKCNYMALDTIAVQSYLGYESGFVDLERRLLKLCNERDYLILLGHTSELFNLFAWKRVINLLVSENIPVITLYELAQIAKGRNETEHSNLRA